MGSSDIITGSYLITAGVFGIAFSIAYLGKAIHDIADILSSCELIKEEEET